MSVFAPHPFLAVIALAVGGIGVGSSPPGDGLGQVSLGPAGDARCPSESTCQTFTVSACPDVAADAPGVMSIGEPVGSVDGRGTVAFFSGGGGESWWSGGHATKESLLDDLHDEGFRTVEVRWERPWLNASQDERAGTARLACRPATIIGWIHDHLAGPRAGANVDGRCGFCITGNSGGASQVSYALELYGQEDILDAVIPTSGPPHAAEEQGCVDVAGFPYLTPSNRAHIDGSWGYLHGDGPCTAHGDGFDFHDEWLHNSVETAGTDYNHPTTRVQFIFGGRDHTNAPAHARTYETALQAHGSPMVSEVEVPTMGHGIGSPDGLAALRTALEWPG